MRYTPTLRVTTRLVAFVTMIVVSAMFILFIGGVLTFQKMTTQNMNQRFERIIAVMDDELSTSNTTVSDIKHIEPWLTPLFDSHSIVQFKLIDASGRTVYEFISSSVNINLRDKLTRYVQKKVSLQAQWYRAEYQVFSSNVDSMYSFGALFSLTLAMLLVMFCLLKGLKWLKTQFHGSELLEERGRMILAGQVEQYAKGDPKEWPYTTSEALDRLIEELFDARQERSRFDTFIRSHTFLDPLTGGANRALFDSRLASTLQESGVIGGVFILDIPMWDTLAERLPKEEQDAFLIAVGQVLSHLLQKYPNAVFARYYESQFAMMVSHQSEKELSQLATQCIHRLQRLSPPDVFNPDNWCHLGFTMFFQDEQLNQILSEADTALKTARLENMNAWAKYPKDVDRKWAHKGGVRWRHLFDTRLNEKYLLVYQQNAYQIHQGQPQTIFCELFARLQDENAALIRASRFVNALQQVGYEEKIDTLMLQVAIRHIKEEPHDTLYSVNVFTQPFKKKAYLLWVKYQLFQLTIKQRSQLCFSFSESVLIKDLDLMRPIIKMLAGFGCGIMVNQVGRTIVSMHYIKDLPIRYLKLDRSLIKQVEQRPENQLFIRSVLGSCVDTSASVVAVGVDTQKEWDVLTQLGVMAAQGDWFATEQLIQPLQPAFTSKVRPGKRNRWRSAKKHRTHSPK